VKLINKRELKELQSVGSTSKLIRAMDTCWQRNNAYMLTRYLHRGYGRSQAAKQCQEKEVDFALI